jgi:hypothetical protein
MAVSSTTVLVQIVLFRRLNAEYYKRVQKHDTLRCIEKAKGAVERSLGAGKL